MKIKGLSLIMAGVLLLLSSMTSAFDLPSQPDKILGKKLRVEPTLKARPYLVIHQGTDAQGVAYPGWKAFLDSHGSSWELMYDLRTNRPNLIQGQGIPWIPGPGNQLTLDDVSLAMGNQVNHIDLSIMETLARQFLIQHFELFRIYPEDLVLNQKRSGNFGRVNKLWFIDFDQVINGIPVEHANVVFRVNSGNLIQIGVNLIQDITIDITPEITPETATERLSQYTGPDLNSAVFLKNGELMIIPELNGHTLLTEFAGQTGHGIIHRLVYEHVFRIPNDPATYRSLIDARTGDILELVDINRTGVVQGGIFPVTNIDDEVIRPFPYTNVQNGGNKVTDAGGNYTYSAGTASSTLNGAYVNISDDCGSISLSTSTAPGDLNFGASDGSDCQTPGVGGAGNTHAARSCFYHINLLQEKGRAYLPSVSWCSGNLPANVNINLTCNAYWDGSSVNFYRSGGGCSNTGEIASVFLHETGHGLDDATGGNSDRGTGESFADTMSITMLHSPCIGHNFRPGIPCNYGCDLSCTGVRSASVLPEPRPDNITGAPMDCDRWSCPYYGYEGVMGYEGHCEGIIAMSANWDLAELLIAEFGSYSGWVVLDELWYYSTPTADDAYYASAQCNPSATINGCQAENWYTVYIAVDDDNGNLSDGTPHGCHIWQAFNAHGIGCGTQPACYSICPDLESPEITAVPRDHGALLVWGSVPNAAGYEIYRNAVSCDWSFSPYDTTTNTEYVDTEATNGVPYYYIVRAYGADPECTSVFSNCASVLPELQTSAGTASLDVEIYNCSDTAHLRVSDLDLRNNGTQIVTVTSTSDPDGESVTLTEIIADSGIFTGEILLVSASPGIGEILVADSDVLTLTYHDEDHGSGTPLDVIDVATIDCSGPILSNFTATRITDMEIEIGWDSNEPSSSTLRYGLDSSLGMQVSNSELVTHHTLTLTDLLQCTEYYMELECTDFAGNTTIDNSGGSYYRVETYGLMVLMEELLDTDPGWTVENQWAFGIPLGQGGEYGNPDPTSGYTGTNVYGFNLSGDYPDSMSTTYYLTTPVLNCSSVTGGELSFWRYLGVESSTYDHATVEISSDGSTWNQIWANGSTITDSAWNLRTYDISQWADGQSSVQIRWGMGPTDSGWTYCGWNIDDIRITYVAPCNAPILLYEAHLIDDSDGNNDGNVNPGELITMPVTLKNQGIDATGITGAVVDDSTHVSIVTSSADFPDIAHNSSGTSNDPHFQWQTSDDAPDGHIVHFVINWTTDQGNGITSFGQQILAPVVGYNSHLIIDPEPSGDADGILDPGESASIMVLLENAGHQTASNLSAVLTSNHPEYVTIDQGTVLYPDIAPGSTAQGLDPQFVVSVSPSTPDHQIVTFDLTLTGIHYSSSTSFEIDITSSTFAKRYSWNMDTDPGWTATGDWEWGTPLGLEGDPSAGYTGSNVYGYNLSGDYTNNMPEMPLTSSAINCSSLNSVEVRFMRWLGIESSAYDHASFQVSNNGTTWNTIWSHSGSTFTDPTWQALSYDISAYADGQSAVYLRWVMGTTDVSLTYCGWNIDDVEIWAESSGPVMTPTPAPTFTTGPTMIPTHTPPPPPTSTPTPSGEVPTNTPTQVPPTYTSIPPTNTSVPPSSTPTQPSNTATATQSNTVTPTHIPTNTQIPSTNTPIPSETPVPTNTAAPTNPPTETPTASPTQMPPKGMELVLDDTDLTSGDLFNLHFTLSNPESVAYRCDAYILLDVSGYYWSWPDWKPVDQALGYKTYDMPAMDLKTEEVLRFEWPTVSGSFSGLHFYGAIFEASTFDIIGDLQVITWQYR